MYNDTVQPEYNLDELLQNNAENNAQTEHNVQESVPQEASSRSLSEKTPSPADQGGDDGASSVRTRSQTEGWQAKNFRDLRERTAQVERERDEAIRLLEEARAHNNEQNLTFDDDALIEGKHANQVVKEIQTLKNQQRAYDRQIKSLQDEARLRSQYSDFDKVMTEDNISRLAQSDPDLAASLNANPDFYSKAAAVYKVIKQFGIYKSDDFQEDRERAQRNASKPKPLASISPQKADSPLSHANAFAKGLTPELQKSLWKDMEDARKGF